MWLAGYFRPNQGTHHYENLQKYQFSEAWTNIATACHDNDPTNREKWLMPWHPQKAPHLPHQSCVKIVEDWEDDGSPGTVRFDQITPYEVTYALHIPKGFFKFIFSISSATIFFKKSTKAKSSFVSLEKLFKSFIIPSIKNSRK